MHVPSVRITMYNGHEFDRLGNGANQPSIPPASGRLLSQPKWPLTALATVGQVKFKLTTPPRWNNDDNLDIHVAEMKGCGRVFNGSSRDGFLLHTETL